MLPTYVEHQHRAGDIASCGTRDSQEAIDADPTVKGIMIRDIDVMPFRDAMARVCDTLGCDELRDTLRAIAAN